MEIVIDEGIREQLRKAIGANIRRKRGELSLTQQQLADMVGITVVQLNRYENGHAEPMAAVLYGLADALQTPVDSLRQIPTIAG